MKKEVKLINHHCLPILMLLYIMLVYLMLYIVLLYIMLLYIMLAYLMLFAALSNAVCMYNAFIYFIVFLLLIFANAFCFHALSWFIDT